MKTKLFVLPYAFGSSYIYNNLKKKLVSDYDIVTVEYPGHGTRMFEDLSNNIKELAKDVFEQIKQHLTKGQDYAVLGYSMGSIVGFELLKLLQENKINNPKVFFAFASPAPNREEKVDDYEHYSIEDVKKTLSNKKGTPSEILEDDEMLEMLYPIVVNDLIALRDYNKAYSKIKLECPLVVVRGTDENEKGKERIKESYDEWMKFSKGETSYYEIEGEHFFMFESDKNLRECCDIIRDNM